MPIDRVLRERVRRCRDRIWDELLAEMEGGVFWNGELSSSALSTATAVAALALMDRNAHASQIARGLDWLAANANGDGGFGDTIRSKSNISTTFLVRAAVAIANAEQSHGPVARGCDDWIADAGGTPAILAKYGSDRTFSVPILMMGALGGLCEWGDIPRLPFELAALPRSFYAAVRLPVVSYAMPALIAIGQLLHERNPTPWPNRLLRSATRKRTLAKLIDLQPSNGGFLEATPLTSFVVMSLAAMDLQGHQVARRGTDFLTRSQRPDGSWPIDTHLATWVTTLAVNAWGDAARDRLPDPDATLDWLLAQQYRAEHPFTGAAPGGWAWTPLPGGVPDADDTAGAVRAICHLRSERFGESVRRSGLGGLGWLETLRNRDGGIPTFCRGWGTLPFDRSTAELTAHAHEAAATYADRFGAVKILGQIGTSGADYLSSTKGHDGWRPLWFGNEDHPDEANPVYGTARVLQSLAAAAKPKGGVAEHIAAIPGRQCGPISTGLIAEQNDDGGFGAARGLASTVEESAVVLGAIAGVGEPDAVDATARWLCDAIDADQHHTATPIGLYFANLWYFEKLYPHTFSLAALNAVLG